MGTVTITNGMWLVFFGTCIGILIGASISVIIQNHKGENDENLK